MTTAASFTSLQAPLAEDSMEMSSPAQQIYDDDIEIDFEEHVGGVELTDDERMADDTEQPRPGTATDDMMEDDAPTPDVQAPEQEMQDGFDAVAYEQADPDDELIDYDEDEYQDMGQGEEQNVFEPSAPEITLEDREPTDPGFDHVDEEIVREPETSAPEPEIVVAEESVAEAVPAIVETADVEAPTVPAIVETADVEAPTVPSAEETSTEVHDDAPDQQEAAPVETAVAADVAVDDQQQDINGPATPQDLEPFPELPEDSPELKEVAPVAAPLDTNLNTTDDTPGTPTDTGLHPMVIQYGDWEWPLFKSRRQPEGLLKDDNLASVALADLLNNCRSRLALKAGEDISEDQEFVLRFDSTGLIVVENSPSAFNTSLDEILEVFKQLYVNDGAQTIPPFRLYLSLQPKPSSYLTMLKQAAAGGQGISGFVDVPAEEVPAHYEEYYQDGDEDPTLLGDASGIDYDHQAHDEGQDVTAEPELNEADYHEYDTSYENTEGGQEAQDGYEQYEQYDDTEETKYEEYEEGDETNGSAAHAEHSDEPKAEAEQTTGSPHKDAENPSTVPDHETEQVAAHAAPAATEISTHHGGENGEEEQGEESNVESVASSTTLRADQANDAVEDGTDGHEDEFSTFLTEPDQEGTESQVLATNNVHETSGDRDAEAGDLVLTSADQVDEDGSPDDQATGASQIATEAVSVSHVREEADKASAYLRDGETLPSENVGIDDPQSQHLAGLDSNTEQTDAQHPEPQVVEHSATESVVTKPDVEDSARNDEDYIDFGDEDGIDFDDDTYEQHEARKASEANSPVSPSPSGKRPFDETEGIDFAEQPELKKVKSS